MIGRLVLDGARFAGYPMQLMLCEKKYKTYGTKRATALHGLIVPVASGDE